MNRTGRLMLAGAGLGLVGWWMYRQQQDGGATLIDAADDWTFENVGFRIMGDWQNDLNTRGAPYKAALGAAEIKYGIPENMLARLAWQESRFRADIISGKTKSAAGAVGIMQIVPRWHPDVNPYDAFASIDYAGRFLVSLFKKFKSWELALKAYNWGAGNVSAWLAGKKSEPLETANYSRQILADLGGGGGVVV